MSSIEKDARFSRVLTDPRFLPMPKYQQKVKIDKRFNAIFTNKDFGHRSLLDKRGRPINDVSKRGKHIMEQFYQLSSDNSSNEEEEGDDEDEEEDSDADENDVKADSQISSDLKTKTMKKKGVEEKPVKGKLKKMPAPVEDDEPAPAVSKKKALEKEKSTKKNKKRKHEDQDDENDVKPESVVKKSKKGEKLKAKQKMSSDDESEEEEEESSESDDSSFDSSSDDEELPEYTQEFDMEETKSKQKWNELHTDAPEVTDSTHRLALCNMDWDFVKAQDLYVLFKSFVVDGGSVRSVIIYPSEFGKERMAEEAALGPKEMRENLPKEGEKSGGKSGKNRNNRRTRIMDQQKLKRIEKQNVKAELEVLRTYQLNRLRYYYAVVDCSSVEVADNIYKECDGQEYQLSAVKLDLRFIPDDMTFDDTPKESFSEDQGLVDYTPKLFNSTALSQAKVEVTWDETEFDRLQKRMIHAQPKDLLDMVEENKYADIIAPPESDSDVDDDGRPQWLKKVLGDEDDDGDEIDEERKISLYRKVLMDKLVEEEEKEKKDNEIDKELEWQPGLKSTVANKLKKTESDKVHGSIVDDFLEKKKEKRKKKREMKKAAETTTTEGDDEVNDDVPDIIDEDLKKMMESEGIDVDSLAAKKKIKKVSKKKKVAAVDEENSEDERQRAELELLLMGDGDEKSIAKPEKVKEGKLSSRQRKKKALLEKQKKKKEQEELIVDMTDPRFSAMFTSHHFHIDPNAPEFKKTSNMMKLVDEQIKHKPKVKKEKNVVAGNDQNGDVEDGTDSKSVSRKLVESLKRKMKKNK